MTSHILIIEDSSSFAALIEATLINEYGFVCTIAPDFKTAEALLTNFKFDAATVDLNLPDCKSGEALLLTAKYAVPSIILSADFNKELRTKLQSEHILDYVIKAGNDSVRYAAWLLNRHMRNQSLKVLIIDDSISARTTLRAYIRNLGFQCTEAVSGNDGLEKLSEKPDMIIVDQYLPDILGSDLCMQIRNKMHNPDLQIIGVSSKTEEDTASKFLKYGANDYIHRPFQPEEFIHRINRLAEHLDQMRSLQKLNSQKNYFLGMAAHDLRNPVGIIQQSARKLSQYPQDDKQKTLLDIIQRNSENMLQLINDLLDISVIESGKVDLKVQAIELSELVKNRLNDFDDKIKAKHMQIKTHFDSVMIELDKIRINQVIDNLLSNAIKYADQGSLIEVSVEKSADQAQVKIKDNGPGISAEKRSQLFQPFQRLGHTPTGGESSHGLGLAICARIIEAHNGSLTHENNTPHGSIFSFTLPR